jgi:hypothetical protein
MGTSDAQTTNSQPSQVTLPAGWTAGPPRETSTTNQAGQVVQGVQITLSNINGASTTVFVSYAQLQQGVAAVQPIFDQRIAGLSALPGQ